MNHETKMPAIYLSVRSTASIHALGHGNIRISLALGEPHHFSVEGIDEQGYPLHIAPNERSHEQEPASPVLVATFTKPRIAACIFNCSLQENWMPAHTINIESMAQPLLVQQFVSDMARLLTIEQDISDQLLDHKAEELLLLLYNCYGMTFFSSFVPLYNAFDLQFRKTIEQGLTENCSVQELAAKNNQSLSAFKRHFGRIYALSPGRYLQKRRLALACVELLNGKELDEIYFNYGYESISNFIQAFRKNYAVTPKEFQNRFWQVLPRQPHPTNSRQSNAHVHHR